MSNRWQNLLKPADPSPPRCGCGWLFANGPCPTCAVRATTWAAYTSPSFTRCDACGKRWCGAGQKTLSSHQRRCMSCVVAGRFPVPPAVPEAPRLELAAEDAPYSPTGSAVVHLAVLAEPIESDVTAEDAVTLEVD